MRSERVSILTENADQLVIVVTLVAADMGIPATALPLVLGVDRILDMCRTAVNLTGDLTACVVLGKTNRG